MNREIKFRVWDKVDYMSSPFTLQDLLLRNIEFTSDCPVMQYTGLKDKNGKEIYEGDIIEYDNSFFKVVFIPGEIGMKRITPEKNKPTYRLHKIQGEVIGNIYENPELIKKQPA